MSARLSHSEMAEEVGKLVWSKRTWLETFSSGRNKRPDHEIETRRRELAVLEQAAEDYRRAANRKGSMTMMEQDYTDFCNAVYDLRKRAEAVFAEMGDELVYELDGLVRSELAASPGGKVAPAYDFLAAVLSEEAAIRRGPMRNVVRLPEKPNNDVPF